MIYFLLFIYLFYLVVKYDVLGGDKYKWHHFHVVLVLLILVSGFRYRLGTDTHAYMNDFVRYPDLFHLTLDDFSDFRYQPFWILLNCVGKTLGSFVFVQIIISWIHIGLLGKVLRRLCPSLVFSSLFFYFLFDYMVFNMEVMRECVSISFFLMALLALDQGKSKLVCIYVVLAFMFHVYSLLVFVLFLCFKKILTKSPLLTYIVICSVVVVCVIDKNFIIRLILDYVVGTDTLYTESAITYATSDTYGETHYNWKGVLSIFLQAGIYVGMLFATRKSYSSHVRFNRNTFETLIFFAVILIIMRYSLQIIDRMYNYFHVFTFLTMALFIKQASLKMKGGQQQMCTFFLLIFIPILFATRMYVREDSLVESLQFYSRYYPYSSVFDKTEDPKREKIFRSKDVMSLK